MGGGGGGDVEAVRATHLEMLSSIVPSDEPERASSLTQSYHHAFEGFAAVLTEDEAAALSGNSIASGPAPCVHRLTAK
jgi:hypothetical protein